MTWKGLLTCLVCGIVLGLYESSIATFAGGAMAAFLPVLPIAVLLVVRDRPIHALVFCAAAGSVVDLFLPIGSGFAFARFLLITLLVIFLARTILTNQSVYAALALMLVARTTDRLWMTAVSWRTGWMPIADLLGAEWRIGWRIAVADLCLIAAVFVVLSLISRKFVLRGSASHRYVG